jgi:hypothetical protein
MYYYMAFQNSLFWLVDKRSVKTHIRTVVRIFRIWTGVPHVVYLAGNFCFANKEKLCFLNSNCALQIKISNNKIVFDWACMPTQWNWPDSRFNSREKHMAHMVTDSLQPYNNPIIDLACSVCTVKYQTSVFLQGPRSFVARSILKNLGLIFHSTNLTRGQ